MKMMIVMRKDLNMRKGKMIAQACHAAMRVALKHEIPLEYFGEHGEKKVCVGVDSEEQLERVASTARAAGIVVELIEDSGHTEFHGVPTKTCLTLGPASEEALDAITGELTLL